MPRSLYRARTAALCLPTAFANVFGPSDCQGATLLGSPTPPSSLINGVASGLDAGDKYFTDFEYSPSGGLPNAAAISVTPILDDQGNYGLRFQGAFRAPSGGGFSSAVLRYDAITLDTRFVQTGAALSSDLSATHDSFITVDQSFLGVNNVLNIYASALGPSPQSQLTDLIQLASHPSTLEAVTDIFAFT